MAPLDTLLVFLIAFGAIGLARGPKREIWTLGGITLTMLFLALGGIEVIKQLPVRVASGFLAMSGNQDGSNYAAAHPLQTPWTMIMLWLGTIGLVAISFLMGQKFGGPPEKTREIGSYLGGLVMGMINGACICVFLFSQGGFSSITIQFPDGQTARNIIAPLILIGIAGVAIGFAAMRPKPKPAEK
jgi:hypothetical protein